MSPTLYALILTVAAITMIVLLLVTSRWRFTQGYVYLSFMLAAISLWCIGGAMEVLLEPLDAKKLFSALSYVGSQTVTVFFLLFVLQYTGDTSMIPERHRRILWLIPSITLLLVFTNDWHHLVWSSVSLHNNDPRGPAHYARGPWFSVMVIYGYLMMMIALYTLVRAYRRQHRIHARQMQLLMLSSIAPWTGHVLYMLRLPLLHGYDASPLGFALTGPLLVFAIFRYGFMDMAPVARDALIETMRDGIAVLDQYLRVADINQAACHMLKLASPQAAVGHSFAELMAHWPELEAFSRRSIPGSITLETPGHHRSPSLIEVDLSLLNRPGTGTGRLLTLRDITRRRQIEEALVASEARYRVAAEKTGQIIYEYEVPTGRIIWTGAIQEITGYTSTEFNTMDIHRWEEHVHPEDVALVMDRLARSIQQHQDFTAEYRFRRKDGTYVHIEERAGFITPPGHANNRLVGIMSDVTQSYSLKEQLHQSQKMEAIGRLAGGIAHDFNNLLMVIMNSADFLRESIKDLPDACEDIREILHASRRASELTRQLLLFSRKQPLKRTLGCVGECIANVEKMLHRIVGEDILIEIDIEPELPPVLIDTGLIELAIMNLAVNARDAMPGGGTLILRGTSSAISEADYASMIEKPPHRTGLYARVDIIDSGTGMSPELLKRIFEPFFTTKGIGKGTGLGLSTAFGIVRQHAGYVAVASRPDRGSRFTFYIPFSTHAVPLATAKEQVYAHYQGKVILLVEDDPSVRRILLSMLRNLDLMVLEAEHGHDALAKAKAHPGSLDLLLTDVIMPGMDGYRLAGHLREMRPEIKVAYVSGYPRDQLNSSGISDDTPLLSKPFTRDELIRLLHQVFDPESARTVNPA